MKKLSEIKQEGTNKNQIVTKSETVKGGGSSCGDKRPGNNYYGGWNGGNNQSGNWNGGW